ncbi:M4 family metallopeptidase [Pyxidicoccus xibeiensis]|uniref:M4 family metallopeptidase n=1 Tax=Pyxidicoccus xibeiensis TaxID=2906759 RepID=UPI0020A81717|nr:M4 family metallopeptidase [Pyxidicoccus xibeiensis]MCP3137646.1 M4 family metallopeptidase [Pyxidicoccus xibeiensis]
MKSSWKRSLVVVVSSLAAVGCHDREPAPVTEVDEPIEHPRSPDDDVEEALRRLPDAQVLGMGAAGVPTFVRGDLGKVDGARGVDSALEHIAPVFRLSTRDLDLTRADSDVLGFQHVYYAQTKNGLPVVGGELALHINAEGVIYAVHGTAHDGVPLPSSPLVTAERAAWAAQRDSLDLSSASVGPSRLVYLLTGDGGMQLAWEQELTGLRAQEPVHDAVYVDALSGQVLERRPRIHSARVRQVHDLAQGTRLPGGLARSEGAEPVAEAAVNVNYDRLGDTYDCYKTLFNRDSFDNQGAALISSVHYGNNFVNAFWNGTQMVFGGGDGVKSENLARSLDITAHEWTHAVIQRTANLAYSGEPGGLNESMADVFASVCESFREGGVTGKTWTIGEDVWTPNIADDALRYMSDPRRDGVSIDYYMDYYSGLDVHYSSGIANLAFHLLSQGGTHPRGRSSVVVPGIGIGKARWIWYWALTTYMTSGTDFLGARNATRQAAADFFTLAEVAAVEKAWSAVGVPPIAAPPDHVIPLSNGVPLPGLAGATGNKKYFSLEVPAGEAEVRFELSGGVGDADLYVKFGSSPTISHYDCRSSLSGNGDTCRFTNPPQGTWHVMVHAYNAYSDASVRGTFSNPLQVVGTLTSGVPVPNLAGAAGSKSYWKLSVPAGQPRVTFAITGVAGVSGDADLYVRRGTEPTLTTHDCAPRLQGNQETCTLTNPAAGDYFVMLHGYLSYSVVSLSAQYP